MKVPLESVPEGGRHVDISADAATRAALADEIGLRGLPHAEASFDLARHGADGIRVRGRVTATVEQNCVVSLDALESPVDEDIDLLFVPADARGVDAEGEIMPLDGRDPPEALREGAVDLGAIATEFLVLGINFYPRKPGVVFEGAAAEDDPGTHPFAALAALKAGTRDKK
jgi:uncharacterized metal-binding protein YceD (DUF177 family)